MKKLNLIAMILVMWTACGYAQQTDSVKVLDKKIETELVAPVLKQAKEGSFSPDFTELEKTIALKYDDLTADRNVSRQKIYYYYAKDWSRFCAALVHFTEKYEDKGDVKLMAKNAGFVLQASQDVKELEAALSWVKPALLKDPANEGLKKLVEGLEAKILKK